MTGTAADLLARVHRRLNYPSRWHGDADSRRGDIGRGGGLDREGRQVNACDPTAVSHCVIGAIKVEAGIADAIWPLPDAAGEAFDAIVDAGGWPNDALGYDAVFAAIDTALTRSRQPVAKTIITSYVGEAQPLRSVALPTVERYAAAHGYDVVEATQPEGLAPHWGKVAALRDALRTCDLAVWIDGDAAFLDAAPDLADCLPGGAFQGFAHHPLLPYELNSWLWVLRAGQRADDFLGQVWDRRTPDAPADFQFLDLAAIHDVLFRSPWLGQTHVLRDWSQTTDEARGVERYAVHLGGDQAFGITYAERAARLRAAVENQGIS
ncbi:MAG TPA: hypothetical protein VHR18_13450 [Solirubrobacterales bacterium]|jgi:hypothetical protein|nr:hypothetical protein [Solirubrobacterales bacterium]